MKSKRAPSIITSRLKNTDDPHSGGTHRKSGSRDEHIVMETSMPTPAAQAERQMDRGIADNERGWTPRPDPTVLTTDQLRREIAATRELFDAKNDIAEVRFAANDKALSVLQSIADRQPWPAVLEERTIALREVIMQKFETVLVRFEELGKSNEALTLANKTAIDAAFKSAQEVTSKVEAQFTKQIDQLRELTRAELDGIRTQINDLKLAAAQGVGSNQGAKEQTIVHNRSEDQSAKFFTMGISLIMALIGVGALAISFMK